MSPAKSFRAPAIMATRTIVAAFLLFSGVLHALQPYLFVATLSSYALIPHFALFPTAIALTGLQLGIGAVLLYEHHRTEPVVWALFLFSTYALAQISVIARGMNIDCGCFGLSSTNISYATVSVPIALSAACLTDLLVLSRRQDSDQESKQNAGRNATHA